MKTVALYSAAPAKGWLPWGALAPILCVLFIALPSLGISHFMEPLQLENAKGEPIGLAGLLTLLLVHFAAMLVVVLAWVRFVERRPLATIGLVGSRGSSTFMRGLLIGVATSGAVVAAIWASGGYVADGFARAFASPQALLNIAALLICFAWQSSVEEIIFRGWLLSAIARKFNIIIAVVLVSLVFTLLHYSPNQPWLVVSCSFLFSAFACTWAIKTGNIWGVMGWHAGWNWLLAVGFEVPVTGIDAHQPALLVKLIPQGPINLTGGSEGPEGSFFCSVFFLVAIAFILWRFRDRKAV